MVAILGSLLVSYARARAEGLGLDCKVGIAQRAERILGVGFASLLAGAGPHALLLETIVALLALASLITVVQRFVYVYQHAGRVDEALLAEEQVHARDGQQQPEEVRRIKRRRRWTRWRKDTAVAERRPGKSRLLKANSECSVWDWAQSRRPSSRESKTSAEAPPGPSAR